MKDCLVLIKEIDRYINISKKFFVTIFFKKNLQMDVLPG